MSTVARLSLAQYDRMIDAGVFETRKANRIELIRGELRKMTPIGPDHEDAVDFLNEWSLAAKPPEVRVRIQNSVGFPELKSAPQPDVAWVTRKFSARRPEASEIFLIIEVAQTSLAGERGEKARLYAKAGVRDYWIVNIPDKCVEVFRDPLRGRYKSLRTYATGDEVSPLAFPDVTLSVSSLFESVASPDDRNSSL
ncbi:MAG TPA: Uma2 family endonuclease [Pirellulales bacterium]|nr:Uma2 family endonuclease [Pirellulales bacterium]